MKTLMLAAIRCFLIFLVPALAYAGSAEWNLNPTSGDWNTPANWTPTTVPTGPADIATFALSNTTNVSISANTEVNAITFTPAATNPYTISANPGYSLTLSGTGITNNSAITQNFVTNGGPFGQLIFTNNATAGNSTIFTNNHGVNNSEGGSTFFLNTSSAGNSTFINENGTVGTEFFGFTYFFDSSTAAHATLINNGTTFSDYGDGGETSFVDSSTAGNAMVTNNGDTASNAVGGITFLYNTASAGNGTFINNAGTVSSAFGGFTIFTGNATAASGTLIANGATISDAGGGQILFSGDSTGGTSRIEVFGDGSLDISGHNAPSVTIGSIEGDGDVFLGANNLTVGSNDFNTTFSGVIADGGFGALLTKIVSGTKTHTDDSNVIRGAFKIYESISSDRFVFQDGGWSLGWVSAILPTCPATPPGMPSSGRTG